MGERLRKPHFVNSSLRNVAIGAAVGLTLGLGAAGLLNHANVGSTPIASDFTARRDYAHTPGKEMRPALQKPQPRKALSERIADGLDGPAKKIFNAAANFNMTNFSEDPKYKGYNARIDLTVQPDGKVSNGTSTSYISNKMIVRVYMESPDNGSKLGPPPRTELGSTEIRISPVMLKKGGVTDHVELNFYPPYITTDITNATATLYSMNDVGSPYAIRHFGPKVSALFERALQPARFSETALSYKIKKGEAALGKQSIEILSMMLNGNVDGLKQVARRYGNNLGAVIGYNQAGEAYITVSGGKPVVRRSVSLIMTFYGMDKTIGSVTIPYTAPGHLSLFGEGHYTSPTLGYFMNGGDYRQVAETISFHNDRLFKTFWVMISTNNVNKLSWTSWKEVAGYMQTLGIPIFQVPGTPSAQAMYRNPESVPETWYFAGFDSPYYRRHLMPRALGPLGAKIISSMERPLKTDARLARR